MPDDFSPSSRANILLVDDIPANLLALEAVLDGLGANLVRATSGREALDLLGKFQFAVVLLDVKMPSLNGFETAKHMRESERTRHTPIIFLSAGETAEFPIAEAYRLGAVDYLVKPILPVVLKAKVAGFVELMDRRQAEEALRASEERYRAFNETLQRLAAIVESSEDAIVSKTVNGSIWTWNGGAERLFGYSAQEAVGQSIALIIPPDRFPEEREIQSRLIRGERIEPFETVRVAKDGRRFDVSLSVSALRNSEGMVIGVSSVARDITERKRAEKARRFLADAGEILTTNSLDYEATLSAVARVVVPRLADWCTVTVTTPAGGLRQLAVAHVDPAKVAMALELIKRYPPDPNRPRGVPGVIRTGEPEFVSELTEEMVAGAAQDPEHLAILRNLGLRSVMIVPLAARNRNLGAITFVTAESGHHYTPADLELAVDLGRRAGLAMDNAWLFQECQETLRLLGLLVEASGRLTGSLEIGAVRVAILDLSLRLVAADAYAIWRLSLDGKEWLVADSAGLSEEYLRTQGRIPAPREPMRHEPIVAEDVRGSAQFESRRPGYEKEGIASLLTVPLKAQGHVTGTLVFYYRTRRRFDDVTVRVATALADLAGAALATADLYARESESRKRAEEADRRKDEFLAVLAHELRNPLAPIRNSLQILRLSGSNTAVAERVRDMMERQVKHLGRLVDDLLDASRITTGKFRLTIERLNLLDSVHQAVADHRTAFEASGVTLKTRMGDGAIWVNGDATRLAQVLDNLMANALKFTPGGGTVELAVGAGPGETAVLVVRDDGAGIEEEMLPRLFVPFAQADRTLDRSGGGLGLGLAIVKGLIGLHGGTVRAESAGLGRGSTFTVTLPAQLGPSDLKAKSSPQLRLANRQRVLVVEDNRDSAESLQLLLETYGYQVQLAYSGPEGIRAAETYLPDVIICDIGLPGLDGYGVAAAVRRNPSTAAVRLVALTGYGQEEDQRRAREAGFDEHLTKPADPSVLEMVLSRFDRATPA